MEVRWTYAIFSVLFKYERSLHSLKAISDFKNPIRDTNRRSKNVRNENLEVFTLHLFIPYSSLPVGE